MDTILHINGDYSLAQRIDAILKKNKFQVYSASCFKNLPNKKYITQIICHIDNTIMNDYSKILSRIKKKYPKVPIIFITDGIRVYKAIELAKEGLYSCINKPIYPEVLLKLLKKAKKQQKLSNRTRQLKTSESKHNSGYIIGKSKAALQMHKKIDLIKNTNFSVIVYGETGTGKESVARLIADTDNNTKPLVSIDCGCLTRELARSELFGHKQGAFTGATYEKKGAFELANNGTLFLDEVANLELDVQMYLLRAIQEQKINKVGSEETININVRIIVASNEDLNTAVQKGKFREDLFHRLNEFKITIPPLRDRREDIPFFTEYFIQQTNKELNKNVRGVSTEVHQFLMKQPWRGNIREFRNTIRHGVLLAQDNDFIKLRNLPLEVFNLAPLSTNSKNKPYTKEPSTNNLKEATKVAEIKKIYEVLASVNNNKTEAAKLLHIDRKTLYNKIKEFNITLV